MTDSDNSNIVDYTPIQLQVTEAKLAQYKAENERDKLVNVLRSISVMIENALIPKL